MNPWTAFGLLVALLIGGVAFVVGLVAGLVLADDA